MKNLLFAIILLLPSSLLGQGLYSFSQIAYNPDPYTGGTTIPLTVDDMYSGVITMPFSFCFADSGFQSLVVGSNGVITFDTALAGQFCPWALNNPAPNAVYPNYSIMAPYHDIDPSIGGTIEYDLRGTAPYRRFVISYSQIPMFSCNPMLFTQQIVLYETTNVIELNMLEKPLCTSWNNGLAILGIQVNDSTGWIVPGRNAPTQWAAQSESWRFSPVGPCAAPSSSAMITGRVYEDLDNDCIFDSTDIPRAHRAVIADSGAHYTWTDQSGMYYLVVDTGSWNIWSPVPQYYGPDCGITSHNVTISSQGQTSGGHDFVDTLMVVCTDLWVDIGTPALIRCGTSNITVDYCNLGSVPDTNVVVTVTLNDSLQIQNSNVPYTPQGNNVYTFNFSSLGPGQCGSIYLQVSVGCDTLGTVYHMYADIAGDFPGECDTTNNHASDCHPLVGSFDPNRKDVAAQVGAHYVETDTMSATDELTYLLRFQNVGTAAAINVEIRDTLSSYLNAESVQPGASSHFYNFARINNVLIFYFPNIMLPDSASDPVGSNGFVKFKVEQRQGNTPGTTIENNASIYFDQNAPVVTNSTFNHIPVLVFTDPGKDAGVSIYPNPGHDILTVDPGKSRATEFILRDVWGRTVLEAEIEAGIMQISTSKLSTGIYFWQSRRDGEVISSGKWIKK